MINRIKEALEAMGILKWKIEEVNRVSQELYFIGKKLDMNRSKQVRVYEVTVYMDFEEEGENYTGDSMTTVDSAVSDSELREAINATVMAAKFVRNKAYELYTPSEVSRSSEPSKSLVDYEFDKKPLFDYMSELVECIYENDLEGDGGINSCEIFIKKYDHHLVTSTGVDTASRRYDNMIEVVADWNGEQEAVELMFNNHYGDFSPKEVARDVLELVNNTKLRAKAQKTMTLSGLPVLLSGESAKDFFASYVTKANGQMKYDGLTNYEIGQKVQGDDVEGDLLTLTMLPVLKGSTMSASNDGDGYPLKEVELVKEGILLNFITSVRYGSYLNMTPTGQVRNMKVSLGKTSRSDLEKAPYVEILSFSDLSINAMSGDMGGEIRLAKYFDGSKTSYLTGGAISSNISKLDQRMLLADTSTKINNYEGPEFICFKSLDVQGA